MRRMIFDHPDAPSIWRRAWIAIENVFRRLFQQPTRGFSGCLTYSYGEPCIRCDRPVTRRQWCPGHLPIHMPIDHDEHALKDHIQEARDE